MRTYFDWMGPGEGGCTVQYYSFLVKGLEVDRKNMVQFFHVLAKWYAPGELETKQFLFAKNLV